MITKEQIAKWRDLVSPDNPWGAFNCIKVLPEACDALEAALEREDLLLRTYSKSVDRIAVLEEALRQVLRQPDIAVYTADRALKGDAY